MRCKTAEADSRDFDDFFGHPWRYRLATLSQASQVSRNGILDIRERFAGRVPLAYTSWERGNFGNKDTIFILLDDYPVLSGHTASKHKVMITGRPPRQPLLALQTHANQ